MSSFASRMCDCSMYGNVPHQVTTRSAWTRHLALKAEDRRQAVRLAVYGNAFDPEIPELEDRSPPLPLSHPVNPWEPPSSPVLQLRNSSDSVPGPASSRPPSSSPIPEIEYDLPINQSSSLSPSPAPADVHAIRSSQSQQNPTVTPLPLSATQTMESDVPSPVHEPVQSSDVDHGLPHNEIGDLPPVGDILFTASSDSEVEAPDLGDLLAESSSSYDSDEEPALGQMRQGFIESSGSPLEEFEPVEESSDEELGPDVQEPEADADSPEPELGFDYRNPTGDPLTKQDMLSIALDDITLKHKISREASNDTRELFSSIITDKMMDYRTIRKQIEKRTGIKEILYDCCPHSHMSYAMYPELERCTHCDHPRWMEPSSRTRNPRLKVPYATHSYIPVAHRISLLFSKAEQASLMTTYRSIAEKDRDKGLISDYWSADLFNDMKTRHGLFSNDTDIGFLLSTDGVKVFKSRRSFSIWPLLLVNLNLPPAVRFKKRNMLLLGFIPGPNNPKDIESFLFPLIQEFLLLERGIPNVWNASRNHNFTLRAHICLVAADMPGREKLMNFKGVFHRGVYCPLEPPTNPAPPTVQARYGGEPPDLTTYDSSNLPMRDDTQSRRIGLHVVQTGDEHTAKRYGIKGPCCLSQLKSIDIPRSFPPDAMHLWWENIIPDLVKHWRGRFFSDLATANINAVAAADEGMDTDVESEESEESGSDLEIADNQSARRRRSVPRRPRARIARGRNRNTPVPSPPAPARFSATKKFVQTDDEYNIRPSIWLDISRDMVASANTFPTLFGDPIRNFAEHCHHLKAAEWRTFAFLLAPIYLKGNLPDEDYEHYLNLIDAIQLACDNEITVIEVLAVGRRIKRFIRYYENRYYKKQWERLSACLPVFHQVLHVADGIRWAGPMFVYWQWPMERVCGMIAASAKSRVSANRNMAITMLLNERRNHLPYVIALPGIGQDGDNSEYEDQDGNILLHRFFARRLKAISTVPPDPEERSRKPHFSRPARKHTLSNWERRYLKFYLQEHIRLTEEGSIERFDMQVALDNLPTECIKWSSCTIYHDLDPFVVTSSSMKRVNATRNSSIVMFDSKLEEDGVGYGEIIFFFSVVYSDGARVEEEGNVENRLDLAYVQQYTVEEDGRLLYRSNVGIKAVIPVDNIVEMIGLIRKNGREYLTRRYTSLF
ncbi:uncharacterized protein LAJ45_03447 [Morchella importuna]|uniref:uncharacterized protein n=1 Tax=Morchella importuna TaxID=1174673 RepID=UPI001E8DFFD3|nr:uncharacterized protein LAJ45_03447 [Morchella importuna]KAH8152606.1 hypothetical protein LAJ45_03447 [Morchella importuna]